MLEISWTDFEIKYVHNYIINTAAQALKVYI